MTSTSAPLGSDLIDHDLICLNCAYNLRMMKPEGTCPECGMDVAVSLRRDRLAQSSPQWLGRLGRVARLLQLGVILTLPLLYVGVVVATAGLWMLTAAEPNRTEPAGDRNLRLAARVFVVLGCCGLIAVSVAMVVAIFGRQYQLFDDWLYADAFIIAAHGVYLLGLLASWSYLATFAQRMDNDQLLQQCKRMRTCWRRSHPHRLDRQRRQPALQQPQPGFPRWPLPFYAAPGVLAL